MQRLPKVYSVSCAKPGLESAHTGSVVVMDFYWSGNPPLINGIHLQNAALYAYNVKGQPNIQSKIPLAAWRH